MPVRYSRMADGSLAAWISAEPARFTELCDRVVHELGGQIREELIDPAQAYVDIELDGHGITLHREGFLGVAVLATTPPSEPTVRRVAEHLIAD